MRDRGHDVRQPDLEDAPPCVWMTAGIVAWRLCDRNLDCEHCPLDAALRGPTAERPPAPAASWTFPDDRLYHPGHTWVRQEAPGRIRCGIDALVARLFAHVRGVVLPALGSRLIRGQVACWLEDGDELIPLRTPVTGAVLARNASVQADARLLARDPYGRGWLFEVEAATSDIAAPDSCTADRASREAIRQLLALERRAARVLTQGRRRAGATAADGGEPLSDLRRMLGAERYRRLVRRVIG